MTIEDSNYLLKIYVSKNLDIYFWIRDIEYITYLGISIIGLNFSLSWLFNMILKVIGKVMYANKQNNVQMKMKGYILNLLEESSMCKSYYITYKRIKKVIKSKQYETVCKEFVNAGNCHSLGTNLAI